jgi:hypothetical protein
MSSSVLYMSMSLDGFIAGPDDDVGQGLLGEGRRLFEQLGPEHVELELTRVVGAPGVTHLRYRVMP